MPNHGHFERLGRLLELEAADEADRFGLGEFAHPSTVLASDRTAVRVGVV